MLRLKKWVDLNVLTEFGFVKSFTKVDDNIRVQIDDRTRQITFGLGITPWFDFNFYYATNADAIYNLIKADLVELVEQN